MTTVSLFLFIVFVLEPKSDAPPRRLNRLARRSTRSLYTKLAALWPLQLLQRLLTPQTCRTIAEVKTCHRGSSSEPPEIYRRWDFNCTASPLSLPSHRSLRLKTPGYELWAFSSLMNWASNAGDRGDSLISVSRWQIFIEFWTEISLYFLPWITEILAPMAPVYEGKMVLEMCCFFPPVRGSVTHPGVSIVVQLNCGWYGGRDAMHPLLFQSKIIKHVFTICFPDVPHAGSAAVALCIRLVLLVPV